MPCTAPELLVCTWMKFSFQNKSQCFNNLIKLLLLINGLVMESECLVTLLSDLAGGQIYNASHIAAVCFCISIWTVFPVIMRHQKVTSPMPVCHKSFQQLLFYCCKQYQMNCVNHSIHSCNVAYFCVFIIQTFNESANKIYCLYGFPLGIVYLIVQFIKCWH